MTTTNISVVVVVNVVALQYVLLLPISFFLSFIVCICLFQSFAHFQLTYAAIGFIYYYFNLISSFSCTISIVIFELFHVCCCCCCIVFSLLIQRDLMFTLQWTQQTYTLIQSNETDRQTRCIFMKMIHSQNHVK